MTTSDTPGADPSAGDAARAARVQSDERFFGFRVSDDDRVSFVTVAHLCRPDLRLYGGAAIGASLAAIERHTGRDAIWVTTQFVGSTGLDTTIDLDVDVLAPGHRTSQVRVQGRVGDDVIFESLGAAAVLKPDGIAGTVDTMPLVPPPDDCEGAAFGVAENGWFPGLEARVAHPADDAHHLRVWTRFEDGQPVTAARLGYIADVVPMGIMRGLGRHGGGTSLDNTMRIASFATTGWVLLDVLPHVAMGGYGHGTVHLWGEDGALLATGSQTAKLMEFGFDPLVRVPRG